jgi:hypothetical protein
MPGLCGAGSQMSRGLKQLAAYCVGLLAVSIAYYVYVINVHPPSPERETFLSEIGEGFGEIALWVFGFIYLRTVVKLLLGKGPIARRLVPDYSGPTVPTFAQRAIAYLDRSHIYLALVGLAVVFIHIALLGLHAHIWFFPMVLALLFWQALFGMFVSWKLSPRELRKFAYAVHAQLVTGVAIGLFAYFGHLVIDD